MASDPVYLGIDCGATTSKVGGVDHHGRLLSRRLRQRPTRGGDGPAAILDGWMAGVADFLDEEGIAAGRVAGVGLAIPGPYRGHGVLGPQPNLPRTLDGWRFLDDLNDAVSKAFARPLPVVTANDGLLAGLGEAAGVQSRDPGGVLMLAPGSGLGCSYVRPDGELLGGDHGAAVILCHMPAPHGVLGLPAFPCGCGRAWGCFEAYTSLSGLPRLIDHLLPGFPEHEFAASPGSRREQALRLRALACDRDPLALAVFDTQARAMGLAVAVGCMAYDPTHVIIGGGLMDPDATTAAFRSRYIEGVRAEFAAHAWGDPASIRFHEAALGDLSQAIGAALLARRHAAGAE